MEREDGDHDNNFVSHACLWREKERQREVSRLWWYELTTLVSNRIAYHKFEHVRIKINKKIKRSQRKRPKAFVA